MAKFSYDDEELKKTHEEFFLDRKDLRGSAHIKESWRLLLTFNEIQQFVQKVADELNTKLEGKEIIACCLLKGCVYFFVDLTRKLKIPYSTYFIEVSSYHSQKQGDYVQIASQIVPSKFAGKKVLLIDELYDNGATMDHVKQLLLNNKELNLANEDIYTCTLFRKKKKVNAFPPPDFVGCDGMPDIWVVGYGLDDMQEKRGWQHLYACPKIEGIPKESDDKIFEDNEEAQHVFKELRGAMLGQLH